MCFWSTPECKLGGNQLLKLELSKKLTAEKRVVFPASGAPVRATVEWPFPDATPFEGREDPSEKN